MPLNFFAPHAQYARHTVMMSCVLNFKNMVKAFIRPGIGVVLESIQPPTCEGDSKRRRATASRVSDSAGYYMLSSDPANPYANYSRHRNTLNFARHTCARW